MRTHVELVSATSCAWAGTASGTSAPDTGLFMTPNSDIAQRPGMGAGKGFLAATESGELAVEIWKTDQTGAPTHDEGMVARGYEFDAVRAFFTIHEDRLDVYVYEDADRQSAHRLMVELDPRLSRLELQEPWNFEREGCKDD